ncbi:DUF6286 domain-containing protein [Streptomyces sp. NPDC088097]|uniref:DUF6286 domain-containing protein n=1 Tax=Streptomyces sp. NPDC088097 TaxID=3365823 RepID=UPI0038073E7E
MERDQEPPAVAKQPTATDELTSRRVEQPAKQPVAERQPTPRPWSTRRVPAALTALLVGAVAGILLFDVVRVRAGQTAATWRERLADELATRPLDDIWIRVGAAAIAVLGLWMLVMALTHGLRHKLPLKTPDAQTHAVLDRDAAELLLRDAAMRVPGVSAARVRIVRNRVGAHADVRYRAPADVKADLLVALPAELDRLALARPPRLAVKVRPRRK